MFEKIEDVPKQISEFYTTEVKSEPTGNMIDEPYVFTDENGDEQEGVRPVPEYHDVTYVVMLPWGEMQDSVEAVLAKNCTPDVADRFVGFANNIQNKEYHDEFLSWFTSEPIQVELLPVDGEDAPVDTYAEQHAHWVSNEPARKDDKVLSDYAGHVKWLKMQGVEFDGVMCSATKEDMWGLNSVEAFVKTGNPVNFEFDNGNILKLTAKNIDAFYKVWAPFRASFF